MAQPQSAKRPFRRTRRPFVETLEDRTLLSISRPPAGTSGPVTLTGTPLADQFVMRLQPSTPANLQLSDNGGAGFASVPLANVTGITVLGLSGRDTLTIDHRQGLVAKAGVLNVAYDGGPAPDFLVLAGSPGPAVSQVYQVGATSDAGTLLTTAGGLGLNITFSRVSSILDTVPAAALAVNLNDLPNLLKVEKDVAAGGLATLRLEGMDQQGRSNLLNDMFDDSLTEDRRVESRESFVPLTFAAKSNVTVNLLGGDDLIVLDSPQSVSGLVSLTIDGGREAWVTSGLDLSRMREGFQSSLEFYDDNRAGAARVQFDANGRARLTGTSVNHDDKHFFVFTPAASGTLGVTVQTTNGKFAKLQIENAAGVKVFETEPNDGVNTATGTVQAGVTYFVRLRSPDSGPATYVVDLTLT